MCIYIYICVYVYIYIYIYVCVCMYVCMSYSSGTRPGRAASGPGPRRSATCFLDLCNNDVIYFCK